MIPLPDADKSFNEFDIYDKFFIDFLLIRESVITLLIYLECSSCNLEILAFKFYTYFYFPYINCLRC